MRLFGSAVALSALLAFAPVNAGPGDHVVVGTAIYPVEGEADALLTVVAHESDTSQGGTAVWHPASGPERRITLTCVYVWDNFEIGHALFASGTGDDGLEYYIAIHEEFIVGELSALVAPAADPTMPCGAPREVPLSKGYVEFLI